jgi:transposase
LKNFRRIATRYEKRAANYLAMITIGAILLPDYKQFTGNNIACAL